VKSIPGNYARPLGQVGTSCGTKGDRLGIMAKHGLNVPLTYVITPEAFRLVLEHNNLRDASEISEELTLPGILAAAIQKVYLDEFSDGRVVVRSSASSEDSPFISCAGQYESFVNLASLDAVLEAVRLCYISLTSDDAHSYHNVHGHDDRSEVMSVLIQKMIKPSKAGVLFTQSIYSTNEMLTEFVSGMGTPVVSGTGSTETLEIGRSGIAQRGLEESLRETGLILEKLFEGPQDVEWGWTEAGKLYVFQSRDIVRRPQAAITLDRPADFVSVTQGKRVSAGVGIGALRTLDEAQTAADGYILVIGDQGQRAVVDAVTRSSAVVMRSTGVLSHLATVIRELGKPAIAVDTLPALRKDGIYVIDASNGLLGALDKQHPVVRKQLIYEAFRTSASSHSSPMIFANKIEAVSLDADVVRRVHRALGGARNASFIGIQTIYPHDLPEGIYCGISARIQQTGDCSRVQIKRVVPGGDAAQWRRDEEVLVAVSSVDAGRELLRSLGYVELETQERVIELYHSSGCKFQFNYWPGSASTYVGIEAPEPTVLRTALCGLEIDPLSFRAIDGVEIFQQFGLERRDAHLDWHGQLGLELDAGHIRNGQVLLV
jgi:phosphohistidine swiveling domain-containing protein